MNYFAKLSLVFLFAQGILPVSLHAEVIDRVVASVGNDAITLYDVEREGGAFLREVSASAPPEKKEARLLEARKSILEKLIEKVVLMREAKRMGIEVEEEDLQAAIDSVKQENKIGQEELVAALKKEGITYERYREELKGQMLRARVIDRKVRANIALSDDEIKMYFERNRELFTADEEINARHILFSLPVGAGENDVEEIREKATAILEEVRKGGDFAVLAKENSDGPSATAGGDLGYFRRGDMVAAFSDAAFALKVGEVSSLVLTPFGFHIIELMERRGGKQLSFDEVKEKIRATLYSEEMERGIKQFIEEVKERDEVAILLK